MPLHPNRISAFGPFTPQREQALARQLLEIQSEQELDRFLPLLAAAVPMLTSIAGPLLKNVAGSLFGGGGGSGGPTRRRRPRDQQEQFLGNIVKGFLGGEMESESYEQEQFLGGIFKGLLGGEMEGEQQQFLGGIIGKLFGGRELEAENYVQEQFLGGIVKGLLGGEMESESAGPGGGQARLLRRARRFIRLVNGAAGHAATQLSNLQRAGHRPSPAELRRIVLGSIVQAARRFAPRLAAVAFPGESPARAPSPGQGGPPQGAPSPGQGGPPQGQTVLEMMMADAAPVPIVASADRRAHRSNGQSNGYPLG